MARQGTLTRTVERREANGLVGDRVTCPCGSGSVLSRQQVFGDRETALDGSRSGSPLNGDLGKARGNNHDAHGGGRRRALVADEDPRMLWLLQRALADDFDVTVAQDGSRAVELALTACPEVIVLDLTMPVMDGFAACRLLHAAYPRVPIVIVSGHTDEDSVRAAFAAGATDYLTKPFTPSQLRARLQACLLRVR